MNEFFWIIEFFSVLIALALGLVIGFLYKQNQVEKAKREQLDESERLVEEAKQNARQIEIKARDQAIELIQKAENDLDRKRTELSKEEDRLQKRREELDNRVDRM
jgi:ribonuclease Y